MSLSAKYAMKKRMSRCAHGGDVNGCEMCMMAKGGQVKGVHKSMYGEDHDLDEESSAGHMARKGDHEGAKEKHKKILMEIMAMKKPMLYAQGGEVANDVGDGQDADEEENQFDDMVKDDHLDFEYTGANSGDYDDDEQENMDRRDTVSQIMKSRRKKDKNPRPA